MLERGFAAYHDLPREGVLRLAGGQRLRYVGVGGSPEYFIVTRPGGGEFGGAEAQLRRRLHLAADGAADRRRPAAVNDAVMRLRAGRRPGRACAASWSAPSPAPASAAK